MLTESLASTILTASIAGAGLILAIYALITPISTKLFKERVKLLNEKKKQFDELKAKISSESSKEEFEKLKKLAREIKEIKTFPRYLGDGVLLVFLGYFVTSIFSALWLSNPSDGTAEVLIPVLFYITTVGFFGVGFYAITDVYRTMRAEYEEIKSKKEEVEESYKTLEKTLSMSFEVKKKTENKK